MSDELSAEARLWLSAHGFDPIESPDEDPDEDKVWLRALTHGSHTSDADYERLEFLGDRVLGLVIADWLFEQQQGPEGKLSMRLNALVSRKTCARIAQSTGLAAHIRLGKQAREDGGTESTNILGDVMEALLGAAFRVHGYDKARAVIRALWAAEFEGDVGRAKHPKSALQEWAAGNRRTSPHYELIERSGPDHAARFTVRVTVRNIGEATATASSKSDAEAEAAKAFMERFG